MLLLYLFALLVSFYLLAIICEEFFVVSLDILSEKLQLRSDVAGATLMAVGSSAPELFTALIASFQAGSHSDIGAGTIVGSAIFNILVIIGASALFKEAKLTWQPVVRDTLFYALSIVLLLWAFWDGQIVFLEAAVFVLLYFVYIVAVFYWPKLVPYKDAADVLELHATGDKKNKLAAASKKLLSLVIPDSSQNKDVYLRTFFVSIVGIALLSYVLVEAAVGISEVLHIHPAIIALTVLAAGTSIPDLLSSMIVAQRGRGDMAISNAVGSNIFDILFGLGVPWLLVLGLRGGTVPVATENLLSSVFLLFATVVAVFFLLVVRHWTIGRKAGVVLIALYFGYLGYAILQVLGGS